MEIDAHYNYTNNRLHIGKAVREIFLKSGLAVKQFDGMIPCKEGNVVAACRRRGYRKGSDESQKLLFALPLGRVAPPLVANCSLSAGLFCLVIFLFIVFKQSYQFFFQIFFWWKV